MELREMLGGDTPAIPVQDCFNIGIPAALIQLYNDQKLSSELLCELTYCLCNLATGSHETTEELVRLGGLEVLQRLITLENSSNSEQAIWGIGNIAGDSSHLRDIVIYHRVHQTIGKLVVNLNGKDVRLA